MMTESSELSRRERQIMDAVFALGEATVNKVVETIPSPTHPVLKAACMATNFVPAAPRGTLIAATAKLPVPLRRFRPAGELVRIGDDRAPRIQFPLNGSRLDVAAEGDAKMSPVAVKVAGGVPPMTVLVNGRSVGELDSRRQKFVEPPGPGFVRLTVMDSTGAADTVVVRLQ